MFYLPDLHFRPTRSRRTAKRLPLRYLRAPATELRATGAGLARSTATAAVADRRLRGDIVIPLAPAALILTISALGLHPVALINRSLPCYELPANIRTTTELQKLIAPLLARSPTLRAQCAKIAAAERTWVSVTLSVAQLPGQARARSTARRSLSGVLMVDIEIPAASQDFGELLAHELEHVTEFIERVDFKALADARDSGVLQCTGGSFESARAQQAGRSAAAEIEQAGQTDQARQHRTPPRTAPALPMTRWRN